MTSKTITHALACCPCSRVLFGASALSSLPQRGLASSSRRLSRASRLSLFGLLTLDACCNARSASARCASGGGGGGGGALTTVTVLVPRARVDLAVVLVQLVIAVCDAGECATSDSECVALRQPLCTAPHGRGWQRQTHWAASIW
jgi:hypothetical protein